MCSSFCLLTPKIMFHTVLWTWLVFLLSSVLHLTLVCCCKLLVLFNIYVLSSWYVFTIQLIVNVSMLLGISSRSFVNMQNKKCWGSYVYNPLLVNGEDKLNLRPSFHRTFYLFSLFIDCQYPMYLHGIS